MESEIIEYMQRHKVTWGSLDRERLVYYVVDIKAIYDKMVRKRLSLCIVHDF